MAEKRINSKNKGSSNERNICKILSEKLAPFKFIRSQQSGAIVGGKNFEQKKHLYSQDALKYFLSDIVCSNEDEVGKQFKFVIEAKFYKEMEKWDLLLSGKSQIYEWLEEVRIDAEKINKQGLVIFKYNRSPYYVAGSKDVLFFTPNVILLPNGSKICYLDDLLKDPEWWIF